MNVTVREFREILVWPLQLEPLGEDRQIHRHWDLLAALPGGRVWHEVEDEFGDPREFKERHYAEFVTFLPPVQRFLYGEGAHGGTYGKPLESSLRVFRRNDIARVRVTLERGAAPIVLDIAHADLYFFYDLDIVLLALEIFASELPLATAQDLLFRLGRAYPAHWDSNGRAAACPWLVEWLAADGTVLCASDYDQREKYLAFVCEHRVPCIAAHWEYLLEPIVLHGTTREGPLRFRLVEYYRMPLMAYLAVDELAAVTRADFVRLALVTGPGEPAELPYSGGYLSQFEHRYCYDRHYGGGGANATRTLTCGHAMITVGNARSPFFSDRETGFLGQFRHQYFLIFLVAHLHAAALLMLSGRLALAIQRLDIRDVESIRRFKRTIRQTLEIFLRFTHRYWFHELSIQVQARELFAMLSGHLGTDLLYKEVRDEVLDMEQYLDSDTFRRQANVVVRLTVITIVGLIGTTVTGFLGMNLVAEADAPPAAKIAYFLAVFVPVTFLVFYSVAKSKRLADFLETLSDERASARAKLHALLAVWSRERRHPAA